MNKGLLIVAAGAAAAMLLYGATKDSKRAYLKNVTGLEPAIADRMTDQEIDIVYKFMKDLSGLTELQIDQYKANMTPMFRDQLEQIGIKYNIFT